MSCMDLLGAAAAGAASEPYSLPAYLRAPEVTNKVMAEYIWLGVSGQLRSKTKVLDVKPGVPEEAPVVVATEGNPECEGETCEDVFLKPRKIFRDPFRGGDHVLVLCDTFRPSQAAPDAVPPIVEPTETNTRVACENVLKVAEPSQPVFAAEQQYAVIHPAYPTMVPLGPPRKRRSSSRSHQSIRHSAAAPVPQPSSWPKAGMSTLSGSLSLSSTVSEPCLVAGSMPGLPAHGGPPGGNLGRTMSEAHLRCCLFSGVNVTGAQASGPPGVQSFKVGPCKGVDFGDQVWASRYLLQRVAEDHGAAVSFQPNAIPGGPLLGCHIKYSTAETRSPGTGVAAVQQQLGHLQATHIQHLAAYHPGRLGMAVAAGQGQFTHSIGGSAASVTVPSMTLLCQGGYYVDRRPPSDADPYASAMLLASTTLGIPLPMSTPIKAAAASCSSPIDVPYSHMSSYMVAARNQQVFGSNVGSDCAVSGLSHGEYGYGYDDDEDDNCSETESMETEGSYDLLVDELERMDRGEDDEDVSGGSDCESEGECDSDGTSPDRSAMAGCCGDRDPMMAESVYVVA